MIILHRLSSTQTTAAQDNTNEHNSKRHFQNTIPCFIQVLDSPYSIEIRLICLSYLEILLKIQLYSSITVLPRSIHYDRCRNSHTESRLSKRLAGTSPKHESREKMFDVINLIRIYRAVRVG
jgi:hypothetical protein